jgi:hypothetical protein
MHACMYVDCVCVYLYTNKDAAQTGIQTEALLKEGTHVCMYVDCVCVYVVLIHK